MLTALPSRTSPCRPVSTMHALPSHRGVPALAASALASPCCQLGVVRCGALRKLARSLTLRATGKDPAGADTGPSAEQPESVGEPVEPDSKGAESSYGVLMERFVAAVEEDYADTDFLRGFVEDANAEFAAMEASVSEAQAAADTAQKEAESMQAQYLRLNADFENFRRRAGTEKDATSTRVKAKTIEDLLPVIDAFDAAAGQVKVETEGEKKIAESYQGLYSKLVEAFKKMGLEVVPGKGAPFDPNVHDAIMRAPSDEVPDGTVLQEFRKGFRIGSTLLRPAMVQVSFREDDSGSAGDSGGNAGAQANGGLAEGEEILQEAIAEEETSKA